ncbi:MAG TPA: family 16 glycoside hydrolase [Candidatus Sulfotelmatobacter sp.]|nr:family 16 glycoside hydrolase [Candidatus Sulfotelmatobacter sp.]
MNPKKKNLSNFLKTTGANSHGRLGPLLLICTGLIFASGSVSAGKEASPTKVSLPLNSMEELEVTTFADNGNVKAKAEVEEYRGRQAFHMMLGADGQALALVRNSEFKDGAIELDLAATPRQGAPADSRGFVGVAFRVQEKAARFETVYLRMTNGRADDQIRRNHSVQYTSEPDYPWHRLRKESPGVYESYVDLEAGEWTKLRIEVAGAKSAVYVNGAPQPCLIVNDMKLGESRGQVALWVGSDTDAHFSNLQIKPKTNANSSDALQPR